MPRCCIPPPQRTAYGRRQNSPAWQHGTVDLCERDHVASMATLATNLEQSQKSFGYHVVFYPRGWSVSSVAVELR